MKKLFIALTFLITPLIATELCRAVCDGDEAKVRELISQGADLEEEYQANGWPLWYAVDRQSHALTKLLLDAGADPNHRKYNGFTALHAASWSHRNSLDIELVKILLEAGANPNEFDRRIDAVHPALHMAAYCVMRDPAYLEMCRLMVDYGADPYQRCGRGRTVLWYGATDFAQKMTPVCLRHNGITDVYSFFEKQVDRYLELKAVLLGE